MAYDDYSMGGYIPGDYTTETEEERRRRLAAEQAQYQTQDQESGGITAERPSLGDIASQYLGRRVDAAQQRVADVGQVFTDPAAAMERRLGMAEQPDAANTEVQSQQVKTYADGSQEEIVKRQMPAPAPEPAPVAPSAMPPAPQVATAPAPAPQVAPTAPQTQAQAQPTAVVPTAPAVPEGLVAGGGVPERPDIGQVPTPGPAVQVAQAGPVNPAVAPAPVVQQAPAGAPGASLAQAGQVAQATGEDPVRQAVYDARNEKDPSKRRDMFVQVLSDKSVDQGTKALAERFMYEDYKKQRDMDQANQKIAEATPTDLARYMKEQKKEGSYVKAILFARLGLNALAEKEMELLSPSLSMTSMVDDKGNRYAAEIDKNGKITRAFDAVGKTANQEAVARLQASGGTLKGVEVEAGAYKDPTGKVEGTFVLERRPGGSVFREVGTNRIASPSESAILNKTGVQGTLANQRDRMIQEINLKLQGKTAEEQMTILRPYNQQLIAEGYAPLQPGDARLTAPQIAGGGAVTATGGATTGTTTGTTTGGAVTTGTTTGGGAVTTGTTGGAVASTGGAGTGGVTGGGVGRTGARPTGSQMALGKSGAEKAQAANIDLSKEERSNFLTYEEKDIVPKADAGGAIASTRKSQLKGPDGILNNPEIVGMLSGQGGTASEVGNIIRDLVTGARTDEELSTRVASLGITQRQKDVLYNQIQLNRQIAPKTLKENAGAGSVSDAEQKANRDAAINIARVPLYTAVTMLSKDQFDKDQQVARQAFRNANPAFSTVRAFNDAWGRQKAQQDQEYNQIYAERAKYIAKYYQDGANPGAIVDAYKYYPVPEFNRQTGQWDYGTDYARKAARPRLDSFNR